MLVACGGPLKYAPKGPPKALEADAHVIADVDDKASLTHLTVLVEHLAPPARLQSGASTYVVWTRKNDIKAASVPLTAFDLVVSIEAQAAPESPSGDIVLQQRAQD